MDVAALAHGPRRLTLPQLARTLQALVEYRDRLIDAVWREKGLGKLQQEASSFRIDFHVGQERGVFGGEAFQQRFEFIYLAFDPPQLFRLGHNRGLPLGRSGFGRKRERGNLRPDRGDANEGQK